MRSGVFVVSQPEITLMPWRERASSVGQLAGQQCSDVSDWRTDVRLQGYFRFESCSIYKHLIPDFPKSIAGTWGSIEYRRVNADCGHEYIKRHAINQSSTTCYHTTEEACGA